MGYYLRKTRIQIGAAPPRLTDMTDLKFPDEPNAAFLEELRKVERNDIRRWISYLKDQGPDLVFGPGKVEGRFPADSYLKIPLVDFKLKNAADYNKHLDSIMYMLFNARLINKKLSDIPVLFLYYDEDHGRLLASGDRKSVV